MVEGPVGSVVERVVTPQQVYVVMSREWTTMAAGIGAARQVSSRINGLTNKAVDRGRWWEYDCEGAISESVLEPLSKGAIKWNKSIDCWDKLDYPEINVDVKSVSFDNGLVYCCSDRYTDDVNILFVTLKRPSPSGGLYKVACLGYLTYDQVKARGKFNPEKERYEVPIGNLWHTDLLLLSIKGTR
jgi:hypothetical protein